MRAFREACFRTNGWLPASDLGRPLTVGDVFVFRQGRVLPLLNVSSAHLVERTALSEPHSLDPSAWSLARGLGPIVRESLADRQSDVSEAWRTRHVVTLAGTGDFVFRAHKVEARYLLNWHDVHRDLILKLTQLHFAFRDACVVTAVANAHRWIYAEAAQSQARMDVVSSSVHGDWFPGVLETEALQIGADGMARLDLECEGAAHFFKAQRLCLSYGAEERLLRRALEQHETLGGRMFANWMQVGLTDFMRGNDVNINTAMDLFAWRHVVPQDFDDS